MKRKASGSYSSSKKARYASRLRVYRSPSSYGKLQRSTMYHLPIFNGTLYPFWMYFNSNGFYVGSVGVPCIGISDIYNAYDAYRLDKVMVQFTYNNNSSNDSGTAETLPELYTAVDYDSSSVTTVADVLARDGRRLDNLGNNGAPRSFVLLLLR